MAVQRKLCKKCDTYNSMQAGECGWCGEKLVDPTIKPIPPKPKPKPAPEPVVPLSQQAIDLIKGLDDNKLAKVIAYTQGLVASDG
jgi:hypothetical protein